MAFDPVSELPLAPATTTRDRAIAMGRRGIAPRIAAANLGEAPPQVQAWYRAARAAGADIPKRHQTVRNEAQHPGQDLVVSRLRKKRVQRCSLCHRVLGHG